MKSQENQILLVQQWIGQVEYLDQTTETRYQPEICAQIKSESWTWMMRSRHLTGQVIPVAFVMHVV